MIENFDFTNSPKKKEKKNNDPFQEKKKKKLNDLEIYHIRVETNTEFVLRINKMSICKIISQR